MPAAILPLLPIKRGARSAPPPPLHHLHAAAGGLRKLGFTTRKTMRVAQDLYEGVELKDGNVGLVTYIRTDSLRLSSQAVEMAREYIKTTSAAIICPQAPCFQKQK